MVQNYSDGQSSLGIQALLGIAQNLGNQSESSSSGVQALLEIAAAIEQLANSFSASIAGTKITVFTSSGTFVPDAKMLECEVSAWGAGGAGGGAATTGAGQASIGSGGNGGALAYGRFAAAQIGASQSVTVGAGGTGVAGGTGNAGGNTTFGALINAKGGEGGGVTAAGTPPLGAASPASSQSATGAIRGWTIAGDTAIAFNQGSSPGATGAATPLGGNGTIAGSNQNGNSAQPNTGSGGAGAGNGQNQATARSGGAGGSGILIVKEYLRP